MIYLSERLKEASTWRGIIALLTSFGVAISPEQAEALVAFGLALIGAIGVFTGDKRE